MTDDTPLAFDLPAVRCKKLTVDFEGGTQSSDAGLPLLRENAGQEVRAGHVAGGCGPGPASGFSD
jgi:hypothetical protein